MYVYTNTHFIWPNKHLNFLQTTVNVNDLCRFIVKSKEGLVLDHHTTRNLPNIRISSAFVLILRQKVVKEFYTWIWPFHKSTTIDERLSQWTIFIYNVCRFINYIFCKLQEYNNMHVSNKQLTFIVFLALRISLHVN